jgi:hypothetical protein
VSQLFIAEAIGSSGKSRIHALDPPAGIAAPGFSAYAIYEDKKPARLAIMNLQFFNRTTGTAESSIVLDVGTKRRATLKRMTAPGLDEKDSDLVTWAGQAYTNGTASGAEVVELVKDGLVGVRGSEAVLVFFE